MRKRLLTILAIIGILVLITIPMAAPVMAADMGLNKDTTIVGGEPTHPTDIYLLGMTANYVLSVTNLSSTLLVTGMDVSDLPPSGSTVVKATGVNLGLFGGGSNVWTGTHAYTIVSGGLQFVGSPPPNMPHNKIVNTLEAAGLQGPSDTFDLSLTKTSWVATPHISVTKSVTPTTTVVGGSVTYTITITNDGDWPLTKSTIIDSVMGPITSTWSNSLAVGASEAHNIPWIINSATPNPLINTVTATYVATGFDGTISGATVVDSDQAQVNLLAPGTTLNITASPTSLPNGGGPVALTITETNTGTVPLSTVSEVISNGSTTIATLVSPPSNESGSGTHGNGILEPGEIWVWNISGGTIVNTTTFTATGYGYYDGSQGPVNVPEFSSVTVPVGPPPPTVPASSGPIIGLLIAGFVGIMIFFLYRKMQQSHQS